MKKLMSSLVVLSALAIAPALHATPITGQFSVTGGSVQDTGSELIFDPGTIQVSNVAATLTGDFATLLTPGEAGTITSPINYASYVAGSSSLVFGSGSSLLTLTLDSITCDHIGNFGNCTGLGTITSAVAGYDPTAVSLYFSTQGTGAVSFSATAVTPAVPEPSSLLLLGTGLIGAAGALKRRLAA